jgi:hypothetical protein
MMASATTGSKANSRRNLMPTLRSNAVNVSVSVSVLCPVNQAGVLRKLGAMQAQLTNLANSKVAQIATPTRHPFAGTICRLPDRSPTGASRRSCRPSCRTKRVEA